MLANSIKEAVVHGYSASYILITVTLPRVTELTRSGSLTLVAEYYTQCSHCSKAAVLIIC